MGNYEMGEFLAGAMIFAVIFLIIFAVLAIVIYIFQGYGLYKIAKNRGIGNYGLAWVPLGVLWIMGSVADDYDRKTTGRDKKFRHWLLWLSLASMLMYIVGYILILAAGFFEGFMSGSGFYAFSDSAMMGVLLGSIVFNLIGAFIMLAVSILQYIALYKIYRSCKPENAVLFIVLSIVFGITIPFFLFAIRNSAAGFENTNRPAYQTQNGNVYNYYSMPQQSGENGESGGDNTPQ